MLPVAITTKAIQLCAAVCGAALAPAQSSFPITTASRSTNLPEANKRADEGAAPDLLAFGADVDAVPLANKAGDLSSFAVPASSEFDPRAGAAANGDGSIEAMSSPRTVSGVGKLLRRSFNARITDTTRPYTATYGARHSWHKVGQAIDFVPAGGVTAIGRAQIRTLMAAHGVRLIELLGPGDRGHADHWHIAFARPGQALHRELQPGHNDQWLLDIANPSQRAAPAAIAQGTSAAAREAAATAPAGWDVFATAEWRVRRGTGS